MALPCIDLLVISKGYRSRVSWLLMLPLRLMLEINYWCEDLDSERHTAREFSMSSL